MSTTTQRITEEDGIHKEWYKARPSLGEIPEFLRHLSEDYEHDYGTICHALAAGAVATARALDNTPQGGITGFQAGAVMWEFVRHWQHMEQPLRLVDYEHLLYPQYEQSFRTISPETWAWVQEQAREKLAEGKPTVHPDVKAHWERIVQGIVPFGLTVEEMK